MDSSKYNYDWQNIRVENIIGGKTPDGVRYLELFLKDYSSLFNKKNLNASCHKCISDYHKQYIQKTQNMDNKCDYVLKAKYIGIRLEPGSSFMVNNSNITNKIGAKLMKRKNGKDLFDKYPVEKPKSPKKDSVQTTAKESSTPKKTISRSKKS